MLYERLGHLLNIYLRDFYILFYQKCGHISISIAAENRNGMKTFSVCDKKYVQV